MVNVVCQPLAKALPSESAVRSMDGVVLQLATAVQAARPALGLVPECDPLW
jgi:hypothetical protein